MLAHVPFFSPLLLGHFVERFGQDLGRFREKRLGYSWALETVDGRFNIPLGCHASVESSHGFLGPWNVSVSDMH